LLLTWSALQGELYFYLALLAISIRYLIFLTGELSDRVNQLIQSLDFLARDLFNLRQRVGETRILLDSLIEQNTPDEFPVL
jgi:hypothetical protein